MYLARREPLRNPLSISDPTTQLCLDRPVVRIDFGEVQDPHKKSGPFGPHTPNPPLKKLFLTHLVAQSGPFGRFSVVHCHPGYGPVFRVFANLMHVLQHRTRYNVLIKNHNFTSVTPNDPRLTSDMWTFMVLSCCIMYE